MNELLMNDSCETMWIVRANVIRTGTTALFLGLVLIGTIPAQAFPIGGHPDKCQGPYPQGGPACENRGGTVACTNDGDYMCCTKNSQGGQDCEQIESFKGPKGGLRPFNMPGKNAPVMRRGIEGGEPDNSTVAPPDASPGGK